MAEMLDAVLRGATDPDITGVEVVRRPALGAGPADVLAADAVLLGTPANIGYMSGALKHFFDLAYYPVLDATRGCRTGSTCTATWAPRARWPPSSGSPPGWAGVRWPRR